MSTTLSDDQETSEPASDGEAVSVDRATVTITGLVVTDRTLAELVAHAGTPEERIRMIERALEIGARGIASMGIGIDVAEIDLRVLRTVERVTTEAEQLARRMLDDAQQAFTRSLDPEHRSSVVARSMAEFSAWRDTFLGQVDPDSSDSHIGRLLAHLSSLLGPGGALENRLTEALDPTADGSGIAAVSNLIERRLAEIRDLVASERGRRDEADRGTAKGFDYEDTMEEILRGHARGLGIIVERTSRDCGALSGEAMVGDFVLTTPEGRRIVVEAKNTRSLSLTGKDGVLALLDRAKANREADIAICVSAQDAFPLEVGQFGVYGDRIAVVDDGDGAMLAVALRWATESLRRDGHESGSDVDAALIDDRLHRMRLLAQRFSTSRRALTEISGSVDKVRDGLDDIRRELLDLVDEASSGLRSGEHAEVLPLTG